jgi:hypothetical protein
LQRILHIADQEGTKFQTWRKHVQEHEVRGKVRDRGGTKVVHGWEELVLEFLVEVFIFITVFLLD